MPDGGTFTADSSLVNMLMPSPNFGARAAGKAIDMIVLHYTGMKSGDGALEWLCREEAQVSCHYLVFEDGRIVQLVAENKRAWHAGKSCWQGETDINSRSIGIEIANRGHEHGYVDFPMSQMESVVKLVSDIVGRREIPAVGILAHSDIAPLRKEDPGEKFNWKMLHGAGLGVWLEPFEVIEGDVLKLGDEGELVKEYQAMLGALGFEIEVSGVFDELTKGCTIAFQRRYRQELVDGVGDISTRATLKNLLALLNSETKT